jgi:hypothetical protein
LRQESEVALYATPASIESRRIELKRLLEEEIPANRKAIEEARAMGDLREELRVQVGPPAPRVSGVAHRRLDRDLRASGRSTRRRSTPTRCASAPGSPCGGGRQRADAHRSRSVGDKPEEGVVSYESELGLSLLGKKVGDAVEVEGVPYTLTAIGVYVEA